MPSRARGYTSEDRYRAIADNASPGQVPWLHGVFCRHGVLAGCPHRPLRIHRGRRRRGSGRRKRAARRRRRGASWTAAPAHRDCHRGGGQYARRSSVVPDRPALGNPVAGPAPAPGAPGTLVPIAAGPASHPVDSDDPLSHRPAHRRSHPDGLGTHRSDPLRRTQCRGRAALGGGDHQHRLRSGQCLDRTFRLP